MDQIVITRYYCINDLAQTALLYSSLAEEVKLREILSDEYRTDLRSKSDAQIAETLIFHEISSRIGHRPKSPTVEPGSSFQYQPPLFLQYQSNSLQWVLYQITKTRFTVGYDGKAELPDEIKSLKIPIGSCVYRMGIGGLHSSEKNMSHRSDENTILIDRDVVSYYPFIILNNGYAPKHLGSDFFNVYWNFVDRRLQAKAVGDTKTSDSLKIVINGTFGKLGNKYSVLYSPDLLIQVTLTGQLSLLLLIERLELNGIPVVSANTDGVVIKCPRVLKTKMDSIIEQWERDTSFKTEESPYTAIYSRDVNNYIAVKTDGSTKCKGAYSKPGLKKNPANIVCVEAVTSFLTTGRAISETIRECTDIYKFINVRTVKGGAVKVWPDSTEYLGKAIRWYYATGVDGEIVYANSGNKVSRSDGAKPLMELPDAFPDDVDYDWYINEAHSILTSIGYYQK